MEFHIDRDIRLVTALEHKGLYSWSLREFSADGKPLSSDLIPWMWSLYFTASELRYHRAFLFEEPIERSETPSSNTEVTDSESVTAVLHPGVCNDGLKLRRNVSYSMFGTGREISTINLRVSRLPHDTDAERCNLWGTISYTSEIDFRDETVDDSLEIQVSLNPRRFEALAKAVQSQATDVVTVRIKGASGLYSEWSPSISTSKVKVLTEYDDQRLTIPENCAIKPPRLGRAQELELSLLQRSRLNLRQDLSRVSIAAIFEDDDVPVPVKDNDNSVVTTLPPSDTELLEQVAQNRLAVESLRTPLWAIVVLLSIAVISWLI